MSSALNEALRKRTAAKGWVTRTSRKLTLVSQSDTIDTAELQDAVEEFNKRLGHLDETQTIVESLLPAEELERDLDTASAFRDEARAPLLVAARIIVRMSSVQGDPEPSLSGTANATTEANLPRINLPSFAGDVKEWTGFWEMFEAAVGTTSLPFISKLSYLLTLLKGEAKMSVQGLSLTSANYAIACDILKQRYGRPERIIFSHIQDLLEMDFPRQGKVSRLWEAYDNLQARVRSLETLGITAEQYGVVLTPLILSRLPHDFRLEWAREGEGHEADLGFLLSFLLKEIQRKERSQVFTSDRIEIPITKETKNPFKRKTVSTCVSDAKTKPKCVICDKFHSGNPEKCYAFLKKSVSERVNMIKSKYLCFACLRPGHLSRVCEAKCRLCEGKHHESICNQYHEDKRASVRASGPSPDAVQGHCESSSQSKELKNSLLSERNYQTILQVIRVNVKDGRGNKKPVLALFDGGSDHSYVTQHVVNTVRPQFKEHVQISCNTFGSTKPSACKTRNVYNLHVEGDNGYSVKLDATEIPAICSPIYRPRLIKNVRSFVERFGVYEPNDGERMMEIGMLIGVDVMWTLMKGEIVSIPETNLVLQKTVFGWVMSGSFDTLSCQPSLPSQQLLCCNTYPSTSHFQNMWDLDSIGINDDLDMQDEEVKILEEFQSSLCYERGRYMVKLPWKNNQASQGLLNNENIARARLHKLMNRIKHDPELVKGYFAVFQDMEKRGIIVEVPKSEISTGHPTFYMPHRPVVKESSLSTKIRPVFDASCAGPNGVSLNDCLYAGPCLLPNLVSVLLRFRRWPIALTADVKQAFLNLRVHPSDTNVHRFLLPSDEGYRIMKFDRVPFGNKSSPFLLNATVKWHLHKYPETQTVLELRDNLYVDDWLTGCNTYDDCFEMFTEANSIMYAATLPLAKWASNSVSVSETLKMEVGNEEGCLIIRDASFRVLGIQWDKDLDSFVFNGLILDLDPSICFTKLAVLSVLARLFDPLGLLAPFIMTLKIIFQDMWKAGLEWDQTLPQSFQDQVMKWSKGLEYIKELQVSRSYSGESWTLEAVRGLQVFCDASERAYGACVYLTTQLSDGSYTTNLVYSKGKVAPLKATSLPRLELLGALLAARIVVFVRKSLKLPLDTSIRCYTDSMVALSWIRGNPVRWKTFVSNRVLEIQRLTAIEGWHHIPGKENPADLISRGVSGENIVSSNIWIYGPEFLNQEQTRHESSNLSECEIHNVGLAIKHEQLLSNQLAGQSEPKLVFDVARWGSYNKAIRVVAWTYRFVLNARGTRPSEKSKGHNLSPEELRSAEVKLLLHDQRVYYETEIKALQSGQCVHRTSSIFKLNPSLDQNNLMRAQRRLQFSDLAFGEQCPIILPKSDLSKLLIRHYHLKLKHSWVDLMITNIRDKYWIVGLRRLAKGVKMRCVPCQIQDSAACTQKTAPLPRERVTRAPPFSVSGIDFDGPLFCSDIPERKLYLLLFTCAVVRAVHAELVDSLSVKDFLLGFRRFVSRRALPKCIISDNAKTFVAAKERLSKHYGPDCPVWKFNAPLAPWWGAF